MTGIPYKTHCMQHLRETIGNTHKGQIPTSDERESNTRPKRNTQDEVRNTPRDTLT